MSAILRVLRTGAPWRDPPERFGPWSTTPRPARRRPGLQLPDRARVATRYEKRVAHYAAMLPVAAVVLWSPTDALR